MDIIQADRNERRDVAAADSRCLSLDLAHRSLVVRSYLGSTRDSPHPTSPRGALTLRSALSLYSLCVPLAFVVVLSKNNSQ